MAYREHYGLSVSSDWADQPADMNDNEWRKLSELYE